MPWQKGKAPKEGDRLCLSPPPFCRCQKGRCGGLIKIVRENLNGFSAHTFSLQRLFL